MRDDDSDAALAGAARCGDMGAFAVLLVRHRPVLLALCRRTLGDPTLAEDAAQEAALQALLNLDRLQHGDRFGSWLAGIGLNVCRMWLRSRARECWSWDTLNRTLEHRDRVGAEDAELGARVLRLVTVSGGCGDPEERATLADLSMRVREAVDALPPGQCGAVRLFYLSGLSYRETATLLGIAEGTVRTRLHKARGTLRGRLRVLGEEEDLVMVNERAMKEEDVVMANERATQTEEKTVAGGADKTVRSCSFCGKCNEEVHRMIAGPPPTSAIICNECIGLCNQIIAEEEAKASV